MTDSTILHLIVGFVFLCVVSYPSLQPLALRHAGRPFCLCLHSEPLPPLRARAARQFCSLFIWFKSSRTDRPHATSSPRRPTNPRARRRRIHFHAHAALGESTASFYEPSWHYIPNLFTAAVIFCPPALTASTRTLFTDGVGAGKGGGRMGWVDYTETYVGDGTRKEQRPRIKKNIHEKLTQEKCERSVGET